MSQFLLMSDEALGCPVRGGCVRIHPSDRFLQQAASELFPGAGARACSVFADPEQADALIQEARDALDARRPLRSTRLGHVLEWIADTGIETAIWWSSDWTDLPLATRRDELLGLVEDQLRDARLELYARFRPDLPAGTSATTRSTA